MPLGKQEIFEALKNAAYKVSAENFFLTEDLDSPIYPESLVQIEAAKSLKSMLPYSVVKLEFAVSDIEKLLGAGITGQTDRTNGYADITFFHDGFPQAVVEVKDEINGTDDGLIKDAERIQQLLDIENSKFEKKLLQFGALIFYVGKNSQGYKVARQTEDKIEMFVDRTINSTKENIENVVDKNQFSIEFMDGRCIDSIKKTGSSDPYIGTEDEQPLTGQEQMTKYVVAIIQRK
ncbi:hypothetical protein CGJ39_23820 [Vibrio parahaemolyticus]|uniref:hypothetical protein n=1 Tax=Vibrio parahaemolyticus TaxID=670 RepID=UPI001123D616|nr:hypothetical protein [Vibrio parahaemolyticus]TOE58282.1 hypothetical protein CGJ39_23820 [Vibrio parahaemolyticus]HCE2191104.1 hypothetical protein [Vibrio parahaemolyticus]HCE3689632.1 hypothetical protein [Vibrio parahaemolyticus]HCG7163266.1 hypothetical protein [Vibrio parahaemolyticus]